MRSDKFALSPSRHWSPGQLRRLYRPSDRTQRRPAILFVDLEQKLTMLVEAIVKQSSIIMIMGITAIALALPDNLSARAIAPILVWSLNSGGPSLAIGFGEEDRPSMTAPLRKPAKHQVSTNSER